MELKNTIYIHADDYGRSTAISKKVIDCVDSGIVNSVSIMLGSKLEVYEEIKKYKVKKKLHLNLTDFNVGEPVNNKILKNLTFVKLLFLKFENKKVILSEIDRQILSYQKLFPNEPLAVDGHQHVQVIPWIYQHLVNKNKIKEIRLPDEKYFFGGVKSIFTLKLYRNLFASMILKILIRFFLSEKKYSPSFSGMIYSGFYSEKIFRNNLSFLKHRSGAAEIAFHPGHTNKLEKHLFKPEFYRYYSSKNRLIEYDLIFKTNIFN